MAPPALTFRNPLTTERIDRCLEVLTSAWPIEQVARVLDVGCGNGEVLARLRELRLREGARDCAVCGIDPDPDAIAAATERHADLASEEALWRTDRWEPGCVPAGWDATLCLGSRHAFGTGAEAPVRMLRELRDTLAARGRLLVADGIWKRTPEAVYLETIGMDAAELLAAADWDELFTRHGFDVLHQEDVTPGEFEDYERRFWAHAEQLAAAAPDDVDARNTQSHWRNWRAAFERWGRDTMGFRAWVLRVR